MSNPNDPNAFRAGDPDPNPYRRPESGGPPDQGGAFRFDQDESPNIRNYKRSWLDRQFGDASIVFIILFPLCCGIFALAFSLAGVITCETPKARQNAIIVLCISGSLVALSVGVQLLEVLAKGLR